MDPTLFFVGIVVIVFAAMVGFSFHMAETAMDTPNPLIEDFPINSGFTYLGIPMHVVGHWENWGIDIGLVPVLKADYVDGHEVVRSMKFSLQEVKELGLRNSRWGRM